MSDETQESAWPPLHPRNLHVAKVAREGMKHPRSARVDAESQKGVCQLPISNPGRRLHGGSVLIWGSGGAKAVGLFRQKRCESRRLPLPQDMQGIQNFLPDPSAVSLKGRHHGAGVRCPYQRRQGAQPGLGPDDGHCCVTLSGTGERGALAKAWGQTPGITYTPGTDHESTNH